MSIDGSDIPGSPLPPVAGSRLTTPWPAARGTLLALLIVLLYLALAIPFLGRLGVGWDEQVDLQIARHYVETPGGWLRGTGADPSQTRLPMYSLAVIFLLTGSRSLLIARLFSILLGAATLGAVYRFCRQAWDVPTGLLAGLLLATSPYFLSFARVALTESDMMVTCAMAWLLCALLSLAREGTLRAVVITGVTLGLAISAKISAAILTPMAVLAPAFARPRPGGSGGDSRSLPGLTLAAGAGIPAALLLIWWTRWVSGGKAVPGWVAASVIFCLALGIGWVAGLLRHGAWRVPPATAGVLIAALALAVFLMIPPVHTLNPRILVAVAGRTLKTAGFFPIRILDNALFHFLCVVFKSSPLIGAGLWLGLIGLAGSPGPPAPKWILLGGFGFYFGFLIKMNLAQTFYMMPLLPILAMAAAYSLRRLHRARPRLATVAATAAFSLLGVDLVRCAPDYHLNGYQYLGEREVAGHSSVGYRSLAEVTTDGVEQALGYVMRRAGPGDTVVTYVLAEHIVSAFWSRTDLTRRDGLAGGGDALAGADWVIESFNARIAESRGVPPVEGGIYAYPYDRRALEAGFDKVFTVRRAFGIEPARVWRRRGSAAVSGPETACYHPVRP